MIKKGYIKKVRSKEDKREYLLRATDKFYKYYDEKNEYIDIVLGRLADRVSKEDIENLERILEIMSTELMSEVNKYIADNKID